MKEFIDYLSKLLDYEYREIIEVDLMLHNIFYLLSENDYFKNNFLLKGGTCLIKNYLNYYRFSEDIDLTWRNQDIFINKSKREKRNIRTEIINKFGEIINIISKNLNLDFKNDKSNERYYHFSGDFMVNLKLHYYSKILNIERVLKIEVVLMESLQFKPIIGSLRGLLFDKDKGVKKNEELTFLFNEEYSNYSREINLPIYDINEILCEKVRAILTRKVIKGRDFIDVYFILNELDLDINKLRTEIIEKTLFTMRSKKFLQNLIEKEDFIESSNLFNLGDERRFLLGEFNIPHFKKFLKGFNEFLKGITREILNKT